MQKLLKLYKIPTLLWGICTKLQTKREMPSNPLNTVPLEDALRLTNPGAFGTMIKPIGSLCNLKCNYCYYIGRDLGVNSCNKLITTEILKRYISDYISLQKVDTVTFCWHGGEPTLAGIDFFRKALTFQKECADAQGKRVINTLQTNGSNITPEWCELFAQNDFLIGLSIDGPEDIHNGHRKNDNLRNSFKEAVDASILFHRYGVEFNTLSTVNNLSEGRGKEIYIFLKEIIGSRFMQFLPVAEKVTKGGKIVPFDHPEGAISSWSVSPEGYGNFLIDIFKTWVRKDVGNIFVQIFDSTLAQLCGYPAGVCTLGDYCTDSATIESDGEVYPCDHFAFPEYSLGNIVERPLADIVNSQKRVSFSIEKRKGLHRDCTRCRYLRLCNGECPQHRFSTTKGVHGKSYFCPGLKLYFEYVIPYMEYMKSQLEAGLPPANIMKKENLP